MGKNKKLCCAITIISAIFLFLIIILGNFRFLLYNENFYHNEFEKNNVYGKLNNPNEVLDELFLYLKDKETTLKTDIFNEDEKSHFNDVKILINKFLVFFYTIIILEIFLFLFIYFGYFKKNIKKSARFFSYILIMSSSFAVLFSLLLYTFQKYFQNLFIKFHLVFFPQGNWLFPASSNMIKMFPEQFFYDFFLQNNA